ncbi:hypothetical protein ABEB36_002910 [Hypothenemus hampei]|uniref:Uncharacterized protein n=1 Tax=Hypothenemus hampei TaxID=57062 RepID=A0ABD1F7F1_HYPHA
MSEGTPNRDYKKDPILTPVKLPKSPAAQCNQRNLTGAPRVIRDIVADLHSNIQIWNDIHTKGVDQVWKYMNLKLTTTEIYTLELDLSMKEMELVKNDLRNAYNQFNLLENRCEAFSKLPNMPSPVFFSLSAKEIYKLFGEICEAYRKESKVKNFVIENMAHTKDNDEVRFYATCWTWPVNLDRINIKMESLLIETGHRPIT